MAGVNTAFDTSFINAACRRNGMKDIIVRGTLDLASLALAAHIRGDISLPIKKDAPSTSLDSILGALGMNRGTTTHNALTDAALTGKAIARFLQ